MATKSTQVISDLKTVQSNGPSAATSANAIAPNGPILDFNGNVELCIQDCYAIQRRIAYLVQVADPTTDATNLALLQGVALELV